MAGAEDSDDEDYTLARNLLSFVVQQSLLDLADRNQLIEYLNAVRKLTVGRELKIPCVFQIVVANPTVEFARVFFETVIPLVKQTLLINAARKNIGFLQQHKQDLISSIKPEAALLSNL